METVRSNRHKRTSTKRRVKNKKKQIGTNGNPNPSLPKPRPPEAENARATTSSRSSFPYTARKKCSSGSTGTYYISQIPILFARTTLTLFFPNHRNMLAERLLSKVGYDVDRETHALELLKLRFGEHNLHKCEVMLKDMRDSKRLNTNIKAPLAPGTPGAAVDDAHETTETLRKRYVLHFPNCISQFDHTKLTLFWQNSKATWTPSWCPTCSGLRSKPKPPISRCHRQCTRSRQPTRSGTTT